MVRPFGQHPRGSAPSTWLSGAVRLLTYGFCAAASQVGEAFLERAGCEPGVRPGEVGHRVRNHPFSTSSSPAPAEAVAYGLADEVIGGPAGAPESGTPA